MPLARMTTPRWIAAMAGVFAGATVAIWLVRIAFVVPSPAPPFLPPFESQGDERGSLDHLLDSPSGTV
jgi:hypothetical protein